MLYRSRLSQTCKFEQKEAAQAISLALGLSCLGWLYLTPANAQIIPDNSLGTEQSILTPGVDINGSPADLIEGGAIRGSNLFHSFLEFNVGLTQRVYFADPGSISRIVGRVTGNNASFIDGTLGVAGSADLYLINPNGILFGPNAQLDINGSFLASTANGLTWGNGLEFNATNPQAPPLLTINLPVSLNFAPGNTSVLSSEGQLTTGADLTLAAERLELQGSVEAGGDLNLLANQQVQIRDSANQPFNATAQGDLLIQGDQGIDIFTLNHPDSWLVSGNNLTLRSDGDIIGDTRFWSGGDLTIETLAGQAANLLSPNDPIILAAGDVTLGDYTGASLHILASGNVTVGNVEINAVGTAANTINPTHLLPFIRNLSDVTLSDGTSVTIDGTITTLDIRAGVDWSQLSGFPGNLAIGIGLPTITPVTDANIITGDIGFDQGVGLGRVILSNQYFPNSISGNITTGAIDANTLIGGDVILDSSNAITIGSNNFNGTDVSINASACDLSLCWTPAFPPNSYLDGGNVRLLADTSLSLNGDILANGRRGGSINIGTGSDFNLEENLSVLSYTTTLSGQAGDIVIDVTGDFGLGSGATITNATEALAGAGNINVSATGDLRLADGSKVQSFSIGAGQAGDVSLSAENISLVGSTTAVSTSVISKALAQGDAGDVTLTATDQVLLDQGYIFASTGDLTNPQNSVISTGDAGTVTVNANRLTLNTDPNSTVTPSFIAVDSQGAGSAGHIIINTPNGVTELIGTNANDLPNAFVFNGFSTGGPGRLEVNARELLIQDGALISGNAGEQVLGLPSTARGRIDLNVSGRIEVSGSSPSAPSSLVLETSGGVGAGDFVASTQQFLVLDGGNVSAQSIGTGDAGTLRVNANEVRISGESNGFRSRLFFESQGASQAGGVDINAGQVFVGNRGLISVSGSGIGATAGDISINSNTVIMQNEGEIRATTIDADGGNINFRNQALIFMGCCNNTVTASALGTADGGNISMVLRQEGGLLYSPLPLRPTNNDVIASAVTGNGGTINIQNLIALDPRRRNPVTGEPDPLHFVQFSGVATPDSDLIASSAFGVDGTVELNFRQDLESDDLPSEFLGNELEQSCATGGRGVPERSRNRSTFTITGNGGLPPGLDTLLGTDRIYVPLTILPSDPNGTPAVNTDHPPEQTRAPLPATPCQPLNS